MNKQKALKLLEFKPNDNPSKEELNKRLRKLTAKYHPDICKEKDAEQNFKQISAAYEFLKNPPPDPIPSRPRQQGRSPWGRNPFPSSVFIKPRELVINLPLSFKESVLGADKKTIEYTHYTSCSVCEGDRFKITDEECPHCDGNGVISRNEGMGPGGVHTTIHFHCQSCASSGYKIKPCSSCKGTAKVSEKTSINTKLPGGGSTGKTIRIKGKGNISIQNGHKIYGDLILIITVNEDPNMSMRNQDVISNIEVNLLDALKGTSCKGQTLLGEVDVKIPPKSKNQEEIIIPKHGVNRVGNHIFILNVVYPENVKPIIEALEKEK